MYSIPLISLIVIKSPLVFFCMFRIRVKKQKVLGNVEAAPVFTDESIETLLKDIGKPKILYFDTVIYFLSP